MYDLDPVDTATAVTPDTLINAISSKVNDRTLNTLLVMNSALGTTAITKVGQLILAYRVIRFERHFSQ